MQKSPSVACNTSLLQKAMGDHVIFHFKLCQMFFSGPLLAGENEFYNLILMGLFSVHNRLLLWIQQQLENHIKSFNQWML